MNTTFILLGCAFALIANMGFLVNAMEVLPRPFRLPAHILIILSSAGVGVLVFYALKVL